MPELPEVESVRRGLDRMLRGKTILSAELKCTQLRFPVPSEIPRQLKNCKVTAIERRAKFLLINTDRGVLLNHLGMTGYWRAGSNPEPHKHDHLLLRMDGGESLIYNDVRRFGLLAFFAKDDIRECPWLKNLGPEPFDEELFNPAYMKAYFRGKSAAVKSVLMNQKFVVGVGNIYANEALFRAGIRPQKITSGLKAREIQDLYRAIGQVLTEAIEKGGTSFRDFVNAEGLKGGFQSRLTVYGRAGQPCIHCGQALRAGRLAQRSTYWCQKCQK